MNFILNDIDFNNYVVIGVSSGPDSMCLLNIILKKTNKIVVCHINHNIRKESKEEELFLRNYCKDRKLIFESMTINKYEENNFENEARKKRYAFYEEILKKYNSKYLFLAHHGDDLIETVLMKIVRGSNLEGYAGIKEISNFKGFKIVRPLLSYTKEDILDYNKSHNIPYFIDNSNTNTKYTRNRYRKNILPLLKEEDDQVHKKFLRYSKTLEEYDTYIKRLVKEKIDKIFNNNIIYITELNKLDNFLKKNTLYYILTIIYNNENSIITEKHINNILSLINSDKPNLTLDLPLNKILVKEYNKIYFEDKNDKQNIKYKIPLEDSITAGNIKFKIVSEEEKDGNDICRLDSKEIALPLYIRNRKDGDYIILKGSNNKKKIKEIFIEKKLPKDIRNKYPILVDNNDNIIWIPNIKKSNFCIKKGEKNKNYDIIIKCEWKRGKLWIVKKLKKV